MGTYFPAIFPKSARALFGVVVVNSFSSKAFSSTPPGGSNAPSTFVFDNGKWFPGFSGGASLSIPRLPVSSLCDEAFFFPVDDIFVNGIHGHLAYSAVAFSDTPSLKLLTDVDGAGFFESTMLPGPTFKVAASANPWSARVIDGNVVFASKSGLADNGSSVFSFEVFFEDETLCELSASISSEGWDKGLVTVDGVALSSFNNISGTGTFVQQFILPPGAHLFVFSYTKDGSGVSGFDAFYINRLYFYPVDTAYSLQRVFDSVSAEYANATLLNAVYSIANSIDDAHFLRNNSYYDFNDVAVCGFVDCRFRFFPDIPQGTRVASCTFNPVTYADRISCAFDVLCHFPLVDNDISNNPTELESQNKTPGIPWRESAAWTPSVRIQSPDLSAGLSEVFARPGWAPRNATSVHIRYADGGVQDHRCLYAFNAGPQYAAQLRVTYFAPQGFVAPIPSFSFCADDIALADGASVPSLLCGSDVGVLAGTAGVLKKGVLNGHSVLRCAGGGYGFTRNFNFTSGLFCFFLVYKNFSDGTYGGLMTFSKTGEGFDYDSNNGICISQISDGYQFHTPWLDTTSNLGRSSNYTILGIWSRPGYMEFFDTYYKKSYCPAVTHSADIAPSIFCLHARTSGGTLGGDHGVNAGVVEYAEARMYSGDFSRAQFDFVMTELCEKYGFSM